ncbi:polysaccharide pyruvyl transferase family protein [Marinobacter sp. TBZ242]|uniref:Polysaccharide pyruvyl transferase family protein n=1 Tax=Marinobacter azerbaijanicus TaxID=3050455 RepID=A0ABT7I8V9_9GAMM|nr:polysaccharide pyruvyl transferase family protein [Marinobacter sp. TBZ242]MDL0430168.1 polysaccharide pyruvyl transferase family protein [Marinobacter sp. TBZ242]
MKILHAYCLNHNLGDYALGFGVKNLLRRYLPVDLIAETNLQGQVFDEYYIDNVVNKKYDLLVIGGGGIIHGAHWPNGWFWLIKEELIDRIKIPFVVYGAGYNYFEDEQGIPEIGKKHLLKTIERASFFSLRNDESVTRFSQQLSVDVREVPDPGFHINLGREYECNEPDPFVLIQLANDKPEHRFGSSESQSSFVDELRTVVEKLARSYKVIFAPHVYEDIELSERVAQGIQNTEVWPFSDYAFDRTQDCLGFYQKAEFVLAMRGHGQIVPIAFDTPVIALENHPKHGGLMRKLDLHDYSLAINSERFSEQLLQKISLLEENYEEYVGKLGHINEALGDWSKQAMEELHQAVVEKA